MKKVKESTSTTLYLDTTYMPFMLGTARAAMYHMLKGCGFGLDAKGNRYDFTEFKVPDSVSLYGDHPVLSSTKTVWPIPTIFVINRRFLPKKIKLDKDGLPSIKFIWEAYNHICQCCMKKISLKAASRDHVVPKSRNGIDSITNIVLMCKKCNAQLGNTYPKQNVHGDAIVAKMRIRPVHFTLPKDVDVRDEWKPYLFI